jgi:hypothetical protein
MHEIKPLLVDVRQARVLLSCGKNKFWKDYAPRLELLGTAHKRLVTVASIDALVEDLRKKARAEQGMREAKADPEPARVT